MKDEEFKLISELENDHWWYIGRKFLLCRLKKHLNIQNALILDAGCGTGFAGRILADIGDVISMDSSVYALSNSAIDLNKCAASITNMPFADQTYDLITAMDVLEHLDDDQKAIAEMYRICKKDGYLFVTVPACKRMWSAHDESLEHKRRYSLQELTNGIKAAGFSIKKSSYFVSAVFPVAFIYRLLKRKSAPASDLSHVPFLINSTLKFIMLLEAWTAWHIGLPFGMTAFVLARRKS